MFAISSQTYGGVGGPAACSEWNICYRRDAAVPSFPIPRHTSLLAQQVLNCVSCLYPPSSFPQNRGTYKWLITHCWLEVGLVMISIWQKSCLGCQHISCLSLSAEVFDIHIQQQSIGESHVSRKWLMFNVLVLLFSFFSASLCFTCLQWNQLSSPFHKPLALGIHWKHFSAVRGKVKDLNLYSGQ